MSKYWQKWWYLSLVLTFNIVLKNSFYIFPIWITNNIRISVKSIWFKKPKGPQKSLFWTRILVVFTCTTFTKQCGETTLKKLSTTIAASPTILLCRKFHSHWRELNLVPFQTYFKLKGLWQRMRYVSESVICYSTLD